MPQPSRRIGDKPTVSILEVRLPQPCNWEQLPAAAHKDHAYHGNLGKEDGNA